VAYCAIGFERSMLSGIRSRHRRAEQRLLARQLFVGQSGVGKSSIANRLMPGLNAETAELSRATVEGRHVTSVATLHHLPSGGDLIDSPGVRDFAPAIEQLSDPLVGFPEMRQPSTRCRFADCRHLREPDCGVKSAVEAGEISARRYESFRRLARLRQLCKQKRWAILGLFPGERLSALCPVPVLLVCIRTAKSFPRASALDSSRRACLWVSGRAEGEPR
jgi:putative ribosome biogenesis GTPase RsgA